MVVVLWCARGVVSVVILSAVGAKKPDEVVSDDCELGQGAEVWWVFVMRRSQLYGQAAALRFGFGVDKVL